MVVFFAGMKAPMKKTIGIFHTKLSVYAANNTQLKEAYNRSVCFTLHHDYVTLIADAFLNQLSAD